MQLNFGKALSDWVAGCSTCSCSTQRKHVLTGKVAASKIVVAFIPALPMKHNWNLKASSFRGAWYSWVTKTLLQSGCLAKIFVGHVKNGLKRRQLRMSPGVEHHCPCQRRGAHLAPQEWKKFNFIRFFCSRPLRLLFKYCVIYTKTIVRYLYVLKIWKRKSWVSNPWHGEKSPYLCLGYHIWI